MFPSKLVEVMFRAYCAERNMNPEDWPTIGEEKQRAWIAVANVVERKHHCPSCDEYYCNEFLDEDR